MENIAFIAAHYRLFYEIGLLTSIWLKMVLSDFKTVPYWLFK